MYDGSDFPLMFGEKLELEKAREKYLSKDWPMVRFDIWEIEVKYICQGNHF